MNSPKKHFYCWLLILLHLPLITGAQFMKRFVAHHETSRDGVEAQIIKPYTYFYYNIRSLTEDDKAEFKALFADDVIIENDFEERTSSKYDNVRDYLEILSTMYLATNAAIKLDGRNDSLKYQYYICMGDGTNIRAWVEKRISYNEQLKQGQTSTSRAVKVQNWVTLDILYSRTTGTYKIRKITICKDTPLDTNKDGIVDNMGCSDGPLIGNDFIPEKRPRVRQPFGVIITLSGGISQPLKFSPYANGDVLDESTNQWTNGGLATRGAFANASVNVHFGNSFAIGIGVMGFSNPLDSARLEKYVSEYLYASNIRHNGVRIFRDSYRYNLIYFNVGIGHYNKSVKYPWKFEPTIAWADDGFTKNQMIVQIDYEQTGRQRSFSHVKTKPFLMYGASLKMEGACTPLFGVFLAATYLTGKPKSLEHGVAIKGNSSVLTFRNNQIHVANFSVGLQFHIGRNDDGISLKANR